MTFSFSLFQVGLYFSVIAKGGGIVTVEGFLAVFYKVLDFWCYPTFVDNMSFHCSRRENTIDCLGLRDEWANNISASCDVKEDARSSTVALGAASSNHLRVEALLPKASILD
jgi:hypothetical protein